MKKSGFNSALEYLQRMTRNTPLMTQGDVNTALFRMDYELSYCMELAYKSFPIYVIDYVDSICVSILRNGHKRYCYYTKPDTSVITYLTKRTTKMVPKEFMKLVSDLKLFRNEYYIFIANILNAYAKNLDSISGNFYLRYFLKVGVVPVSTLVEIERHFKLASSILEVVETSFYKKVISTAIGFSNGNSDFISDNFMEGADGLRSAIMRFSIYNGGILAGYMSQWIANKMMSFRAPEIISGVPGDIKNLYEKLKEEQKKRNLPTVSDAAKYVKISEERARDIESFYTKEPNIRIEIATQGIDDEKSVPEFMIAQQETEVESVSYLFEGITDLERKCLCMFFGNYDDYPENELSEEDIQKEIEFQNS